MAEQGRTKKSPRWLTHYNALSASLWLVVLINSIYYPLFVGQPAYFLRTKNITTVIQCFAIVEILNSITGVVRAPVGTTAAQVASRLVVVLGVFTLLPDSPGNTSLAYWSVLVAWSITEVIRYLFYAINLETDGKAPEFLVWLRYLTFIILYPVGISSECWLMYKALDEAEGVLGSWYKYFFIVVLAIYVPGSYVMFTYMLSQRRKVLSKSKAKKEVKKE